MNFPDTGPVVLFDGVCNLCNSSVNFIIDRDKKKRFSFASLQSEAADELLKNHDSIKSEAASVILNEGGNLYTGSSAALRIGSMLGGTYSFLKAFLMIPRPIRDAGYKYIARNRYRWFGKSDTCRIPEPGLERRFLESREDVQRFRQACPE